MPAATTIIGFPRDTPRFMRQLRGPQAQHRSIVPSIIRGALAGLLAVSLATVGRVLGDNLNDVQSGRVYRSGQLSPARLKEVIEERQIRTVVNLRGCCPDFEWHRQECKVTHDTGVSQEDIFLSAVRLPSPTEVRRLLHVLDHSDYPILLHCRQGVDRTGLAAVMVQLLTGGVALTEAREQLSLRYGYVPCNGTEKMTQFVGLYDEWLQSNDLHHSPELFRHWAEREYCPGECRAAYEPTDLGTWRTVKLAGKPMCVRLRVRNTSIRDWRFRCGSARGVHARYSLQGPNGAVVFRDEAGRFDRHVPVSDSIELEIGIPRLAPGKYRLWLDMIDTDGNAFCQFGNDPFNWEFDVVP